MSGKNSNQIQETPQQQAMTDLAQKQVADYRQRWLPLQRNLASTITQMGAPDSRQRRQALSMSDAETTAQFGQAQDKLQANVGQTGGLGSSKGKLAIAGLGEDQATASGLGKTQADQHIDDAYVQGLGSIMALGQGQKSSAISGMSDLATLSGRRAAVDAQNSLQDRIGNEQLVGTVAGMGMSGMGGHATDGMQASFSTTGAGSSGFGTGLAYGNTDLAVNF